MRVAASNRLICCPKNLQYYPDGRPAPEGISLTNLKISFIQEAAMTDKENQLSKIVNFIKQDVWRIPRAQLSARNAFLLHVFRALLLSTKRFVENRCQLRASALTYYSLVSIVPVFAMAFGIAKGFGFEKILEEQLRQKLAGHEDILNQVLVFSHSLLANTQGGLIAGAGVILLFWAVVKVLIEIELSLNDIWSVREKRTVSRMLADYLSLILICPVIMIISSGATVFVHAQVAMLMEQFAVLGKFMPVVFFLLKLLPYALMWGLFSFIYMFIPNTKVRFVPALAAGVITGTVFQIIQWACITFQIGVANYNAIYGSFAALPLFLAWLQISWLIVLYGAELSYALQNADYYEFAPDAIDASHRLKMLLSLKIAHCVIKNFASGQKAPTAKEISRRTQMPIRFVQNLLQDLVQSQILSTSQSNNDEEPSYQPAVDTDKLTIKYVVDELEQRGQNTTPFPLAAEIDSLSQTLLFFGKTLESLPENKLLKTI